MEVLIISLSSVVKFSKTLNLVLVVENEKGI